MQRFVRMLNEVRAKSDKNLRLYTFFYNQIKIPDYRFRYAYQFKICFAYMLSIVSKAFCSRILGQLSGTDL